MRPRIAQKWRALAVDLLMVASAAYIAVFLRENDALSSDQIVAVRPYLALSMLSTAVVFAALGINRSVWRFSSMADYVLLAGAAALATVLAVGMTFIHNRLDGIARSLPILQLLVELPLMVGARVAARVRHKQRSKPALFQPQTAEPAPQSVLVVGLNSLSDLYLRAAQKMAGSRLHIAGVLGRSHRQTGRIVHGYPILGVPEQIDRVLQDLAVHGTTINRIIITVDDDQLPKEASEALDEIRKNPDILVEHLAEMLGFERAADDRSAEPQRASPIKLRRLAGPSSLPAPIQLDPFYWRAKRCVDVIVALVLLVVLMPLMVVLAGLVAIDCGRPVTFWQRRPGLGGRPFKLYKLRTMLDAFDAKGERIPDTQRSTGFGAALRRYRLDELPQLFNILIGEMSFIGPRPLLPADQPENVPERLLVRPGLTGWAQVHGGRTITAADKAVLDVWYICNASPMLDLEIIRLTVRMVLSGENVDDAAIERAWRDLKAHGIVPSPPIASNDGGGEQAHRSAPPLPEPRRAGLR